MDKIKEMKIEMKRIFRNTFISLVVACVFGMSIQVLWNLYSEMFGWQKMTQLQSIGIVFLVISFFMIRDNYQKESNDVKNK